MSPAALLLTALLAQTPAIDRSGEAAMKKLMDDTASRRNVMFFVVTSSRESSKEPFYPSGDFMLQLGRPGAFRYEFNDMWGDGRLYVSDGKKILIDGLYDSEPAYLRKAPNKIYLSGVELRPRGERFSPLFYLVDGSASMGELIEKDKELKELPAEAGMRRITGSHKDAGTMTFYFAEEKGKYVIKQIDFDNMPYLKDMHTRFPEWYEEPRDPLTRQSVYVGPLRRVRGLFEPKAGKGRVVQDETVSKKPPKV